MTKDSDGHSKFSKDVYYVNSRLDGSKIYSCRVCDIHLLRKADLKIHAAGRKHQINLSAMDGEMIGKTKKERDREVKTHRKKKTYKHKPAFQRIITSIQPPLIGLEYIIEVIDKNKKNLKYICVLCKSKLCQVTLEDHLLSEAHKVNYLTKHFEPVMSILKSSSRFNDDFQFRWQMLTHIASCIERKFGRYSAFLYEGTKFHDLKHTIYNFVKNMNHISIEDIPDFTGVFFESFLMKNVEQEAQIPIKIEDDEDDVKIPVNVMDEYQSKVSYTETCLENKLRGYLENPKSHPFYMEIWNHFWSAKANEEWNHIDEEWNEYLRKKILLLHETEVKYEINQIRKDLGLLVGSLE